MIHSIKVINYRDEAITIDLEKPENSGFIIRSIDGLGAAKANINVTDIVTNDGGIFNSSRLVSRNIVMKLIFYGIDNIESIRQSTYKYFPIKKELTLVIKTDNRELEIKGYVESNEANIFSNEEGADISIICPNPYFYLHGSDSTNVTLFSSVEPIFEFPFMNNSLTEKLIGLSGIHNKTENIIVYNGDSDVGLTMVIHVVGTAEYITLWDIKNRKKMTIITTRLKALLGMNLMEKDDIVINTEIGNKSISLVRSGRTHNILGCLERGSEWLRLYKGDNVFAYTAKTGAENLQFKIENKVIYEGI